ncbi:MAG: terminase small subunit [Deltaproteobacteria bacterium]|nr:terminase small subunit [Deltaproteobacteria bacterium]
MHQAKNLTWKQERFVSEYLLSGNAAEAVRRAGYQTRYPSEVDYGLKRHPKVRTALIEAQEARARRLEIQADLIASKYMQLMERALEAKDFETALKALNQLCNKLKVFERHQALPLLEMMEKAPNDWEGMLRAIIGVLAIAGKYDELLKALKLKAQLEQASNTEGMYEQALLSLEV